MQADHGDQQPDQGEHSEDGDHDPQQGGGSWQ
jgi:hypothetical protein